MASIVIAVFIYLVSVGQEYYKTPLEERFYHPKHDWFKPSGIYGHGLGIAGTLMMMLGVGLYIARKRYNFLEKYIRIKYLLEFHIFLCVLGPLLIVFHTAFKFGGLVSIAFWCMVAVVASGVIGRFIYIQIPRTIEGRALGVNELMMMRQELIRSIKEKAEMSDVQFAELTEQIESVKNNIAKSSILIRPIKLNFSVRKITNALNKHGLSKEVVTGITENIKKEISLGGKIKRLNTMQNLFKYWHVAHLPFALIMLIIVIVHVIATLYFGYKWIF